MTQTTTTQVICECDSWDHCGKSVELPVEEALEILRKGLVIIVDGCQNGPNSTDVLVEKRKGYSIYRGP
jgi:hypothetical protein